MGLLVAWTAVWLLIVAQQMVAMRPGPVLHQGRPVLHQGPPVLHQGFWALGPIVLPLLTRCFAPSRPPFLMYGKVVCFLGWVLRPRLISQPVDECSVSVAPHGHSPQPWRLGQAWAVLHLPQALAGLEFGF